MDGVLTVPARDIKINPCCLLSFKLYTPFTFRYSFTSHGLSWSALSNSLVGQTFCCSYFCCDLYRKLVLHNSREPCSLLCWFSHKTYWPFNKRQYHTSWFLDSVLQTDGDRLVYASIVPKCFFYARVILSVEYSRAATYCTEPALSNFLWPWYWDCITVPDSIFPYGHFYAAVPMPLIWDKLFTSCMSGKH